jgi:hypothetical protein
MQIMSKLMFAAGGAVLLLAVVSDSASAARICKDGHVYYSGSGFYRNRLQAEASAVRAWRAIKAHTYGATAAANMFPPSKQVHCAHATGNEGWRCFVRGGACKAT